MNIAAEMYSRKQKRLRRYATITFILVLAFSILIGLYRGLYYLPSQTIPEEAKTTLEQMADLTDRNPLFESITIKLDGYSSEITIENGQITARNYSDPIEKLSTCVYTTFGSLVILTFIWAVILGIVKNLAKVEFD